MVANRLVPAFLAVSLFAIFPVASASAADFVLLLKTGQIKLDQDPQTLADGVSRDFDSNSKDTYAVAGEVRWPVGRSEQHTLAVGAEYLRYRFGFRPTSGGLEADVNYLAATVKYYFRPNHSAFRPFGGLALGTINTHVDSANLGTINDDHLAVQYSLGVEYMPQNVGAYLEFKKLEQGTRNRDFDAGGIGVFLGLAIKF